MTATTWNGVLIVALSVALGMYKDDDVMIVFGFAMAGLSYIVNVGDEIESQMADQKFVSIANILRYIVMAVGVAAYVRAAMLLTQGTLPGVQ